MKNLIENILDQTALSKTGLARLIEVSPAMINAVMTGRADQKQSDWVKMQLLSFSAEILITYNEWRRGSDVEPPGPGIIGVAIDVAIWYMVSMHTKKD